LARNREAVNLEIVRAIEEFFVFSFPFLFVHAQHRQIKESGRVPTKRKKGKEKESSIQTLGPLFLFLCSFPFLGPMFGRFAWTILTACGPRRAL
jgi:hypothetical protein